MREALNNTFGAKRVKGLKVGVWYGLGSIQVWLGQCGPRSEFFLVVSWRSYFSADDLANDPDGTYTALDDHSTDAF